MRTKKLTALLVSASIPFTMLATPAKAGIHVSLRNPLPPKVTVTNGGVVGNAINKTSDTITAAENKTEKVAKAAVAVAALPLAIAALPVAAPFLIGKKVHDVGKDIADKAKSLMNQIADIWAQLTAAFKAYGPIVLYSAGAILGLFVLTMFMSLVRNTRDLFRHRATT